MLNDSILRVGGERVLVALCAIILAVEREMMKTKTIYFHCGTQLKKTLSSEIAEVESAVDSILWDRAFKYSANGISYSHQTAYNKALAGSFARLGWERQPLLRKEPKLMGDFRKGLVFFEVQLGNSSTLYRDYYKF